jgi:hypothetical protein
MMNRAAAAALAVLFFAAPIVAHPNSQPDYLRAYVHALILANDANKPFEAMPHVETGSPAQVAAFAEASTVARGTLTQAIDEIAPFTASVNHKIADSAALLQGALEERRKLCEAWAAVYADMGKPDANGEQIATRVTALRGTIAKSGEDLGDSAIKAIWGVVKIDTQGKPQAWAVTWGERRAALRDLKAAFGNDVIKGPRAGHNYVQTAAATFAHFLNEPNFEFLPHVNSPRLTGTPHKPVF